MKKLYYLVIFYWSFRFQSLQIWLGRLDTASIPLRYIETAGSFKGAIYACEIESCERVFDIFAKLQALQKQSIL